MPKKESFPSTNIVSPVFVELEAENREAAIYLNVMAIESVEIPHSGTDGPSVITMRSGATYKTEDESDRLFGLLHDSSHRHSTRRRGTQRKAKK